MVNTDTIREQAADWLTRINGTQWNSSHEQQFQAWQSQSNEHQRIFAEMEELWAQLGTLAQTSDGQALRTAVPKTYSQAANTEPAPTWQQRLQKEWMKLCSLLAMPLLTALGLALYFYDANVPNWQEASSELAEIKAVTLLDGTVVTLSPKSTIKYRLLEDRRQVNLVSGQAFFDVSKDKQRPFTIQSGATQIQVIGTQFDVRKSRDLVEVAVLEGHVKVGSLLEQNMAQNESGTPALQNNSHSLFAGDKITLSHGQQTGSIEQLDLANVATWKSGRLTYQNRTLADVIDDVNRYYDGEINIFGSDLADYRVTATLNTARINSIGLALEKMLPIKVIESQGNNLLIVHDTN